jgi:hypothetical protein
METVKRLILSRARGKTRGYYFRPHLGRRDPEDRSFRISTHVYAVSIIISVVIETHVPEVRAVIGEYKIAKFFLTVARHPMPSSE